MPRRADEFLRQGLPFPAGERGEEEGMNKHISTGVAGAMMR